MTIDVSFPPMVTEVVEWDVPAGANGLVGWRLTSGGGQVIPKNLGAWVIASRQAGRWELTELHDSGAWQVTGYNTGAFPHTVNVRFHTSPIPQAQAGPGPFAWLQAPGYTAKLLPVGAMANAPAVVSVPRAALWPPPHR